MGPNALPDFDLDAPNVPEQDGSYLEDDGRLVTPDATVERALSGIGKDQGINVIDSRFDLSNVGLLPKGYESPEPPAIPESDSPQQDW